MNSKKFNTFEMTIYFSDNDVPKNIKKINYKENQPKKRKKVIHKNTEKEKRDKKQDNDYSDKKVLYKKMVEFQNLFNMIVEYDEDKNTESLDLLQEMKKEVQDFLLLEYYKIANRFVGHPNFKNYTKEQKEDMIGYALIKAMSIGLPGNSNYGIPYFARFNTKKYNNVFSFYTQQIGNFFIQCIKDHYSYEEKKWKNLNRIIIKHNIENIESGIKGFNMSLGDVVTK
jgi:hypothetical protein